MNKHEMALRFDEAIAGLGAKMKEFLIPLPQELKADAQEVRLRAGSPISVCTHDKIYFLQSGRVVLNNPSPGLKSLTRDEIEECFLTLCGYSVYSHQEDIRNGFITIQGGHRAGICGTAVTSNGKVTGIRNVSSINLRISRQIQGAAETICQDAFFDDLCGMLIAGAPSSGKTTILRDIARQLSGGCTGRMLRVAIVDERGEIAGVYHGKSQNNLGYCCDILNGYPKSEGIEHALRCLSPDVIICDEIGGKEDIEAIERGINSGVHFIASIHASSAKELTRKIHIKRLLEAGAFQKIVFLGSRENPGDISRIFTEGDGDAKNLWLSLNNDVDNSGGGGGVA